MACVVVYAADGVDSVVPEWENIRTSIMFTSSAFRSSFAGVDIGTA